MYLEEGGHEERGNPILVGHDSRSGTVFAQAVLEKGANNYAIKRLSGS